MKPFRATRIAPFVLATTMLAGSAGAATSNPYVGLGSTAAQWRAEYQAQHGQTFCMTGNACYGISIYNWSVDATFMFTGVTFSHGIASKFEINLTNGTPLSGASNVLMYALPTDTKMSGFIILRTNASSSCAIGQGTSATLARQFGKSDRGGYFYYEYYGKSSNKAVQYFRPTDVQTVTVAIGPKVASGAC
jgi:hypothetical protein